MTTFASKMFRVGLAAGLGASSLLLWNDSARAACDGGDVDPGPISDKAIATHVPGGVASAALEPLGAHPIVKRTLLAEADAIGLRLTEDMSDEGLGSLTVSGTILTTPQPVLMDGGDYATFVGTSDGTIQRVNLEVDEAGTVTDWSLGWSDSVARGVASECPAISATPAIHLSRFATSSFVAAYGSGTDVVYVSTRYTCAADSDTANRVYAFDASDGTPLWTFNSGATVDVDTIYEDPYLDIDNDRLIIATDRTVSTQDSLISVDLLTGAKAWSNNVGQVWTAPVVRDTDDDGDLDRIYLASLFGDIYAINLSDGTTVWSESNGGIPVTTNIFTEFRGAYMGLVGVVDYFGSVSVFTDDGLTGTLTWSTTISGASASSRIAVVPDAGKVYVGADDGNLYQLRLVDGVVEASRTMPSSFGTPVVGVPTLVFEDTDDNGTLDDARIVVGSDTGVLGKFCYPWTNVLSPVAPLTAYASPLGGGGAGKLCSKPSDCGAEPECNTWECVGGVCQTAPVPNGRACDDRDEKTDVDTCQSGTCSGTMDCERDLTMCTCNGVARTLMVTDGSGKCGTAPGDLPTNEWCGEAVSSYRPETTCLGHGNNSRAVMAFHVFDDQGRPFEDALVTLQIGITGAQAPEWVNPSDPFGGDRFSGSQIASDKDPDFIVKSARPGTYFAMLAGTSGGSSTQGESIPIYGNIRVNDGFTCVNQNFTTQLEMAGSDRSDPPCDLSGDGDSSSYLKVVAENRGKPVVDAPVVVGWAIDDESKYFHTDYEKFVTGGKPEAKNYGRTNSLGEVEFYDFGNQLNGPVVIQVGRPGDPFLTGKFSLARDSVEYVEVE